MDEQFSLLSRLYFTPSLFLNLQKRSLTGRECGISKTQYPLFKKKIDFCPHTGALIQ